VATLLEAFARQNASQGASPFDRALTRYQNNQGILARIGQAGGKTLGVLSYALAPLDYLGGIARSTLFSGANAILPSNKQIDINKNDVYDDQSFLTNLRRAVLQNPFDPNQPIAGFGDVPGLQYSDNDSVLERIGKATLAFGGDVGTDPLTYLSLGIAPVAKKIGIRAISDITASGAAKILARETAESVADDAAEVAAAKLASVAARNEIRNDTVRRLASRNLDIVNAAEVAGKNVSDYVDDLLANQSDDLFASVSRQIGDEATAVFRSGDRRALKNYFNELAETTGIDDFRTLWQAQSDAVRGGFRITTPSGKTIKRLTEGGDSPVLGTLTSPLRALSSKPIGLALTSGADRELVKAAKVAGQLIKAEQGAIPGITDIVERGGLARAAQTEKALRLQRAAARKERELIRKLGPEAKTIIYAHNKVANTYDQQIDEAGEALGNKYRAAVNRWYNKFDEEGGSDLLLINPKDIDEVSAVITDPLERDAFYTARAMRDYLYEKHNYLTKELGDDFNPVGSVQGALRDVTSEARQLEQELFGTTAARGGGGGVKARRAYGVYDESGELVRWRSLEESNQLKKDEWTTYLDEAVASGKYKADDPRIQKWRERIATTNLFETDLPTIFANRVNRMEKQVHKAVAVNLFKRSGLLLETETERALRPKRIVEIAREDIDRLKERNVVLADLIKQANRLRPGAPTGETFERAAGAMIRAQDVGAPADLVRRIEETALSAAEGEATINRTLARSEDDLQVYRDQITTNLNDIKQLNDAIVVLGNMDADAQADGFAALLDTVLDLRKSQIDRMAAQAGNTDAVVELRKSTEALLKAKRQDATQVLSLVARAEPMQRLGTVRGRRNELLQIERQFENLWAPAQVAEALTRAYRLTNDQRTYVEDAFRSTTGVWKQMATFGRGPSFVFRNIGGWWNAFLVGANGVDLTNGLRYAAAYEGALQRFRKNIQNLESKDITDAAKLLEDSFRETMEKSGKFMGYDNMYQAHVAMENQGIFGGTLTAAAIDVDPLTNTARVRTPGQIVERGYQPVVSGANIVPATPVAGQLLSGDISLREAVQTVRKERKLVQRTASVAVNNPLVYVMRAFSEDSERFLRASTFSAGVRRHGADEVGEEIASLLTKASQFDYTDLSPSEQRYMKLISPFFIWTKNNVPFQFRNLLANPGKVNAVLKLQENVKAQFEDKDDDMSEYMPQWLREQLGFASSFASGENQLALGLNLPLADINRFFEVPVTAEGKLDVSGGMRVLPRLLSAAVGGVRDDALGSASPFIKAPIEAATGVNLFTGAKFQEQAAGPVYRAFSVLPGLPDTYVDPETGEVRSSGFAINQFRNLLPQLGQIDRLLPFGQQGEQQARIKGNWISQATSFLPVTVSATLTESQYAGELRTRNLTLENQIREYERANGIPEGSLREAYNKQQQMLGSKARIRALAAALGPG